MISEPRLERVAGPTQQTTSVRLEPWGEGDLALLGQLLGDPRMTEHLGGPESQEKIAERQERYVQAADSDTTHVFKVVDEESGEGIGCVVYWERSWREQQVYEIGWSVLPAYQGRGIARQATAQALAHAKSGGRLRYVHAFPSVDNAPSNAICRKLGFALLEEAIEFEYPPGNLLRCNDWRFDLDA
jgi:RimJ/RimL family protein N-acetyltransferase